MEKLKPCPFCGSEDIRIRSDKYTDGKFYNSLICRNCKAETLESNWNARCTAAGRGLSREDLADLIYKDKNLLDVPQQGVSNRSFYACQRLADAILSAMKGGGK